MLETAYFVGYMRHLVPCCVINNNNNRNPTTVCSTKIIYFSIYKVDPQVITGIRKRKKKMRENDKKREEENEGDEKEK